MARALGPVLGLVAVAVSAAADEVTLKEHKDSVEAVAFSPDGQLLASGSADDTIKLWNPRTKQLLRTLEGHTNGVTHVTFSPDGQLLASGSTDDTIKLWNPHTGELFHTL